MSAQAWLMLIALVVSVATALVHIGFYLGGWRAESKAELKELRIRAKDLERAYSKYTNRRFVPRFLDEDDRAFLQLQGNGEENGES